MNSQYGAVAGARATAWSLIGSRPLRTIIVTGGDRRARRVGKRLRILNSTAGGVNDARVNGVKRAEGQMEKRFVPKRLAVFGLARLAPVGPKSNEPLACYKTV